MKNPLPGQFPSIARDGAGRYLSALEDEGVRITSRRLGWKALHFERREIAPTRRHVSTNRTRHLLFVILEGGVLERESADGKARYELAPGFVVLLPSGYPVRWSWDSRLSFSLLALQPGFVTRVAVQNFGLADDDVQLAFTEKRHDPIVASIAASVAREALQVDTASQSYIESLARVLTIHLLRNYQANRETVAVRSDSKEFPHAIGRAMSFINQNHARDIGLADIAAAARVSRFHLSHVFRNTLGVTLQQYLIQARVQHAHALIVAGGGQYSLADIAVASGFADQSHLTRHFKRLLGMTPGKIG